MSMIAIKGSKESIGFIDGQPASSDHGKYLSSAFSIHDASPATCWMPEKCCQSMVIEPLDVLSLRDARPPPIVPSTLRLLSVSTESS